MREEAQDVQRTSKNKLQESFQPAGSVIATYTTRWFVIYCEVTASIYVYISLFSQSVTWEKQARVSDIPNTSRATNGPAAI